MTITTPNISSKKSGVMVSLIHNGKSSYSRAGLDLYELSAVYLKDQIQLYTNGLYYRIKGMSCSLDDSLQDGYIQLQVDRFETMNPSIELY